MVAGGTGSCPSAVILRGGHTCADRQEPIQTVITFGHCHGGIRRNRREEFAFRKKASEHDGLWHLQLAPKHLISRSRRRNADGLSKVTLSANFGSKSTVLLFFPLAFTGVCTDELCSVSGGLSDYADLGAEVLGISVDSPFAQEAFAKSAGITVPLLSDFNKTVAAAYGVLYETFAPGKLDMNGVAKRSAFVVNKDGVITYAWSSEDPGVLPPLNEVKAALKA